jgi:hypothetical protein
MIRDKVGGNVACMRETLSVYNYFFVGKPEWKRPLGRSRYSWENSKMDLRKMG